MNREAVKSTFPPPPPFYQLYRELPPPPPIPIDAHSNSAAPPVVPSPFTRPPPATGIPTVVDGVNLPLDIYTPPPPLNEAFLKFGELQPQGFFTHQLPPDVPTLYVNHPNVDDTTVKAAADATAARATALATDPSAADTTESGGASSFPYPETASYQLSLRMLNRQYLASYINLLASLTPAPSTPAAPASPAAVGEAVETELRNLSDISANFALLLTKLRPHQASQTIIHMLMKQIERRKNKKAHVESCIADAKAFLSAHGVTYAEGSTNIEPENSPLLNLHHASSPLSTVKNENTMEVDHATPSNPPPVSSADSQNTIADPLSQLHSFLDSLPTA